MEKRDRRKERQAGEEEGTDQKGAEPVNESATISSRAINTTFDGGAKEFEGTAYSISFDRIPKDWSFEDGNWMGPSEFKTDEAGRLALLIDDDGGYGDSYIIYDQNITKLNGRKDIAQALEDIPQLTSTERAKLEIMLHNLVVDREIVPFDEYGTISSRNGFHEESDVYVGEEWYESSRDALTFSVGTASGNIQLEDNEFGFNWWDLEQDDYGWYGAVILKPTKEVLDWRFKDLQNPDNSFFALNLLREWNTVEPDIFQQAWQWALERLSNLATPIAHVEAIYIAQNSCKDSELAKSLKEQFEELIKENKFKQPLVTEIALICARYIVEEISLDEFKDLLSEPISKITMDISHETEITYFLVYVGHIAKEMEYAKGVLEELLAKVEDDVDREELEEVVQDYSSVRIGQFD